jgi:hypothetical protein
MRLSLAAGYSDRQAKLRALRLEAMELRDKVAGLCANGSHWPAWSNIEDARSHLEDAVDCLGRELDR